MKRLCARDVARCRKHQGTLTGQEMTHKQDACKKSRSSLQKVYKGSEHVQRQRSLGPHRLCWVGRFHKHATQTLDKSVGNRQPRLRTQLAQALVNQFQSFHPRLLVANVCCIKVAINTERGITCSASTRARRPDSASASRLLVSTSSPVSYPILRRYRHSRYFAVCNTFVNPSAVFVCVGSLITVHFLSSCFA